jgi:hypothetical protein
MSPRTPVYVKWLDSVSLGSRWVRQSKIEEMATDVGLEHETLGFLVLETELSIVVAGSRGLELAEDHSANVSDLMQIPKCSIIERKLLKVGGLRTGRADTTRQEA